MNNFVIKQLMTDDWKLWKNFRLEALKSSPESFASSYEEEIYGSDLDFQNVLTTNDVFGVFVDNALVSCTGFYNLNSAKTKHRGIIWGMYTRPEYRRKVIANALIQKVINHALPQVTQLHLTCVTSNLSAVALYQKHGFKIYSEIPNALKIGTQYFHEYMMILELKAIE